ncbi:MAG: type III pantothenate kinase [Methylococcales bacterium]|nr:type III pantothenate kinase [Methylococcales bacterium]
MSLLIDMGNTRLKWAFAYQGGLSQSQALLNSELNPASLATAWAALPQPEQVLIACVSQAALLALVQQVVLALWPEAQIRVISSKAQAMGVRNAYLQPEKLGVDRWLALVAVRKYHQTAACIVDCGTAITVDLIDADGQHLGGYISPGLMLMKKSLAAGTSALEFNGSEAVFGAANSTAAAIYSGTLAAAVGLIGHVLSQQAQPLRLILTGGDAGLIAAQLNVKATIDKDLVLRGLAAVLGEPL